MRGRDGKLSSQIKTNKKLFGERSLLEKEMVEKLRNAENNTLRYSELWHGHRPDIVKRLLLDLENEGWIRIFSERKNGGVTFIAQVQLIKDIFTDKHADEIIKKFDLATTLEGKRIVIGDNLLEPVISKFTNSVKSLTFLRNVIVNYDDSMLLNFSTQSLWHIVNHANKIGIKNILERFEKFKKDKELIDKLEKIVLSNKENNTRYFTVRLLILLNPKRSLDSLLIVLERYPLFTTGNTFAELILEAHKRLRTKKEETMKICEGIFNGDYIDDRKQIAKIVFSCL